jgi:serine/threonine protein kinase
VERLAAYGEPVEGTPFGRHRLVEVLGRGSIGEVWRAQDMAANRAVAIKPLPPQTWSPTTVPNTNPPG